MKITKKFISEFMESDFEMSSHEENSRMYGNKPSFETAVRHWLRKNYQDVKYILTDQGTTSRYSKKTMVDMLHNAATKINQGEDAFEFFNSGQPVPDTWFFN